jgi:hypothetical protein
MLKPLRKHRLAFIKVVEGPLIYNFAIFPLVHFSSSFWRNWQSNKASWNILGDVASRATPRGALSVSASGSSLTPCAPRTHTDQAPGSPRWTPAAPHAGQPRVSPRRPDPPPFLPPGVAVKPLRASYKTVGWFPPHVRAPSTSLCSPSAHHWSAAVELPIPLTSSADQPS